MMFALDHAEVGQCQVAVGMGGLASMSRGMLQQVRMADGSALAVPGFVPKLSLTPASHRHNAPALGEDTDAVLKEIGLNEGQIAALRERGIVG